jgi:hypothetical protein
MIVSPFTKKHYVGHNPMDHTAIIRFVEDNFIGKQQTCAAGSPESATCYLTNRDAAQPKLLDFFDFVNVPWATPPAASQLPAVPSVGSTCTPASM